MLKRIFAAFIILLAVANLACDMVMLIPIGQYCNRPAPELELRHINLSIEVREYRPWRLGEILADVIQS